MPDFDSVDVAGDSLHDPRWTAFLEQLRSRRDTWRRYIFRAEIARGGMGAVHEVIDQDARRRLARKVILDEGHGDDRALGRFLEEAQVTSQLDHPGIVPVHEIGVGEDGRVDFTMKLVKGEDLRAIFEKVATGEHGWSLTRALSVLQRVCETMSYAHAKGVIHRDLKSANVMVGRYGGVYVMDWGLARVLGREDTKDVRPRISTTQIVQSERRDANDTPDLPIVTMDGDVGGTPAYMPPEQAKGALEDLGPQADVYSVGARLYHLLAGHMPYVEASARISPRTVLAMVLQGTPPPLAQENPAAPAELVAICEKAMARDRADRYASMEGIAADLRAYLEHRVVAAYETGALAELKEWVRRNRALAVAAAVAFLANAEFDQLAGVVFLEEAIANEKSLYPAWPERIPAMERWLAEEAQRFLHATLTRLADDIAAFAAGPLRGVERRLAWARRIGDLTLRHPNARVTWDEARDALAKADGAVASRLYREHPIDLAPQTGLLPIGMNPATKLWEFYHLRSACDVEAGEDPASLEIPGHRDDGSIQVKDGTGIVFVLIPGGTFHQGAQKKDEAGPNFDPWAEDDDGTQEVALDP